MYCRTLNITLQGRFASVLFPAWRAASERGKQCFEHVQEDDGGTKMSIRGMSWKQQFVCTKEAGVPTTFLHAKPSGRAQELGPRAPLAGHSGVHL